MNTLPAELPSDGTEAFTGLVCPECLGNLVVRVQHRHVTFVCRIGHAFSIGELTTSKEAVVEERMWMAVFAYEELQALLTDLGRHQLTDGNSLEACRTRATLARRQAALLRSVIEADRSLSENVPGWGGGKASP